MNYERDRIIRMLEGTFIGESLEALSSLYDDVEDETESFCNTYSIHCGEGCGTCCEHFMPDITPLEARMVASYILLVRHDLALVDRVMHSEGMDHCPLYDKEHPFHCTVYPARPLICRLFAQCASANKEGKAEFRRCRYNTEETMPEHLSFLEKVPVMGDYGIRLRCLDGGDEEVDDLSIAVEKALPAIQIVWALAGTALGDDDDDSNPTPVAS
jgi:Fe-S-cluster containining protein